MSPIHLSCVNEDLILNFVLVTQRINKMLDELLAEAERKDTVFRADFNQEQRRSFEPFGLGQFMPQIIQIATSIEETKITL